MDMKKIFSRDNAPKLIALLIALGVAGFNEISEQKEAKRIDDMEKRIAELETKKES